MVSSWVSDEQRRVQRSVLTENDTVVALAHDLPAVIENILHVLPDTKTVAVVSGNSPGELLWEEDLRKEFAPLQTGFRLSGTVIDRSQTC